MGYLKNKTGLITPASPQFWYTKKRTQLLENPVTHPPTDKSFEEVEVVIQKEMLIVHPNIEC